MKLCNSFALATVATSATFSTVQGLYLDSLNNGKTASAPNGFVETPIELGHIQESLVPPPAQQEKEAEQPFVMYENGLDPDMQQVVNADLAAAAVQGLQKLQAPAFEEHPLFPEAKIQNEYSIWCNKYDRPADETRYPTFRQNWIRQEEYGRATGQYFWMNEFGDCSEDEYMNIMQMKEQIKNDPLQQKRVDAAASAAAAAPSSWETSAVDASAQLGMSTYEHQLAHPEAVIAAANQAGATVEPLDQDFSYLQNQDSKLVESAKKAAGNYLENLNPGETAGIHGKGIASYLDELNPNEIENHGEVKRTITESYMDGLSAPAVVEETPEAVAAPEIKSEDAVKYQHALTDKYSDIDCVEERAFQVLLDLGMVSATAGNLKEVFGPTKAAGAVVDVAKEESVHEPVLDVGEPAASLVVEEPAIEIEQEHELEIVHDVQDEPQLDLEVAEEIEIEDELEIADELDMEISDEVEAEPQLKLEVEDELNFAFEITDEVEEEPKLELDIVDTIEIEIEDEAELELNITDEADDEKPELEVVGAEDEEFDIDLSMFEIAGDDEDDEDAALDMEMNLDIGITEDDIVTEISEEELEKERELAASTKAIEKYNLIGDLKHRAFRIFADLRSVGKH